MITRNEMLPILVEACPSFSEGWKEHKEFFGEEEDTTYVALGAFANHLVDLYKEKKANDFEKVFEVLEKFCLEGDEYVENAAVVGFIEGLQNIAGNRDLDPEVFYPYLKPISAKWWNEVNKFWNGEVQFIGQTIE